MLRVYYIIVGNMTLVFRREPMKPPRPPWLLPYRGNTPPSIDDLKPLIVDEVIKSANCHVVSIEGMLSKVGWRYVSGSLYLFAS